MAIKNKVHPTNHHARFGHNEKWKYPATCGHFYVKPDKSFAPYIVAEHS
ncbi:MAG: hypothetical protein GX874_01860 [Smithella sp.]|nr:hypothetical protein [Smithella sp.]